MEIVKQLMLAGGDREGRDDAGYRHTEDSRKVLDLVREIKYHLNTVTGDRYAGEWPPERFRARRRLPDQREAEEYWPGRL
jgi:hypothetical protein